MKRAPWLGVVLSFLFSTGARADEAPVDASEYARRLRELQLKVDELKWKVHVEKTRLQERAARFLETTPASLRHRNEVGAGLLPVAARYRLDGVMILQTEDARRLGAPEIDLFEGALAPGCHVLSAEVEYRGNGFGVFPYHAKYRYIVKSNIGFTVKSGMPLLLLAEPHESGSALIDAEESRLGMRWRMRSGGVERRVVGAAGDCDAATPVR